jgi:hypothetical protein
VVVCHIVWVSCVGSEPDGGDLQLRLAERGLEIVRVHIQDSVPHLRPVIVSLGPLSCAVALDPAVLVQEIRVESVLDRVLIN